jgi:hypothetical protein
LKFGEWVWRASGSIEEQKVMVSLSKSILSLQQDLVQETASIYDEQ